MKNMNNNIFYNWVPRTDKEIKEALKKLLDQIWYQRHLNLKSNLEQGVETVDPETWKEALQAAERIRAKYSASELGPWTDFEWGMLAGKLSALCWIRGEDWDVLDV